MRVNTDYWGSLGRRTIDALEAYRCYILRSVTTYSRHIAVSVKKRRNKVKKKQNKKKGIGMFLIGWDTVWIEQMYVGHITQSAYTVY